MRMRGGRQKVIISEKCIFQGGKITEKCIFRGVKNAEKCIFEGSKT